MLNISEREIKKFFKKNPRGWIVLDYAKHSLDHEKFTLPHIAIEKILSTEYPDYYEHWKRLSDLNSKLLSRTILSSPSNMFYTDANSFEEYCNFLFEFLFKLRKMIGDIDTAPYFKRYCSKMSEESLTMYLDRNHKVYKLVRMRMNMTPFYGTLRHIAHRLNLNNKSRYYVAITNFLRKLTHSQPPMSSYSQE